MNLPLFHVTYNNKAEVLILNFAVSVENVSLKLYGIWNGGRNTRDSYKGGNSKNAKNTAA